MQIEEFYWGNKKGSEACKDINDCYEKIVFWKRNLFLLPKGKNGKDYIKEITRLVNAWIENSPLRKCAMSAIHIMPALLLQKPSKSSKSKDHTIALERRIKLWKDGEFLQLYNEAYALQQRLPNITTKRDITALSRRFRDMMQKGNVNGAIKLFTNNMQGGVLPLTNEVINLLRSKHPDSEAVSEESILQGPETTVQPIIFDAINDELVLKAAQFTKGGSGPSGNDADGWRRIITSKDYGSTGMDLRIALASLIRSMCINKVSDNSLGALLASRLVPLDKSPGVRPIGVGEVLRRIMGKVVMSVTKPDVVKASAKSQMCGHQSGSEAAIHAMKKMFDNQHTDAVLLVDAANAFNSLNRNVFLRNIGITCPIIATYVRNCYSIPARLFVIGGTEIKSNEGTTQGDPLGMAIYAIATTPLLDAMANSIEDDAQKEVAFADDITAAGKLRSLRKWWDTIVKIGPKFGYNPQPKKSILIVKPEQQEEAIKEFKETKVKISTEGEKHLGAAIGSEKFRKSYLKEKVTKWTNEITLLSKIGEFQPQAAYACFIAGYQHKMTYFMRTISDSEDDFLPVEEVIRHKFIPAITGGYIVNDEERQLLALPARLGGLGLKIFQDDAVQEYQNSMKVTEDLQKQILDTEDNVIGKTKYQIKAERQQRQKDKLQTLLEGMSNEDKRRTLSNGQKGVSNWLTSLPIKDFGFDLTKQEFNDALRIRYGWIMDRLPSMCTCGSRFDVPHALSCKKGGFVTLRHNELRNITAELLNEVCVDVKVEPPLAKLNEDEVLQERSGNRNSEARLDVSAVNFWVTGQRAFFDIRVFDLNAQRYRNLELAKCYTKNEVEKKKQYNERVLQVENGTFTPLVFSTNGAMGKECTVFFKRLGEMIAEKRKLPTFQIANGIRTKISFSLMRSTIRCVRGSRSRSSNIEDLELVRNASIEDV